MTILLIDLHFLFRFTFSNSRIGTRPAKMKKFWWKSSISKWRPSWIAYPNLIWGRPNSGIWLAESHIGLVFPYCPFFSHIGRVVVVYYWKACHTIREKWSISRILYSQLIINDTNYIIIINKTILCFKSTKLVNHYAGIK